MGYGLLRNSIIAWILLSGLCCHVLAQRPSRQKLQTTLQQLSAQADLRNQINALQTWKQQWQQAGYPTDSTYISGLLELGLAHLYRYDYAPAMQEVRQAVRLSLTQRPDVAADQPAKALYRLGMLLSEQNMPAIDTLTQAIKWGRGIRSADQWVSYAYLYMAYEYYSACDFHQALSCVERGEQLALSTGVKSLMVKLLQEKAKALNELEMYGSARIAAERAVTLSEQDVYPAVIARAYQLLGSIAKNQHQLTDALRYYRRAFEIAQKIQDASAPNYAVSVGTIYRLLHQYEQAISYFQYGVDKNTNLYAKAYSLTQLGQTYQDKKEYAKAQQYYQQALTTMPIGFSNRAITSLPRAQLIQQADQKEYLLTLIQNKADTWLEYAKVTNNQQRFQYALATYQVADRMIDFMHWEHIEQKSKLYWREKTREMYERAIETCLQLNNADQALRFFEKSRAAMLADKVNELGARQKLSPQQIEEEHRLVQQVSKQQANLDTITHKNSPAYRSAQLALDNDQAGLDKFRKRLEASNSAYYAYKYDTTVTSLAELRQHLKKQKASFVTYFVGDSTLYVLGVTPDKSLLYRKSLRSYQQNMQAFMRLLSNPDSMKYKSQQDRFLIVGNGLYSQLLAPLNLPTGSVIVSPDGSFVPFETLSRQAGKSTYLVYDYAFSYTYSARFLLKQRNENKEKTSPYTFLGIAPVSFSPALHQVALSRSDESLERIAGYFDSPELLTRSAATRRAFLKEAAHASVIQLFTHATADSAGAEPQLYFADSTLKLSDLNDGAMPNAQLVVLAACKTGIGAVQKGEGVFSLARGFATLGVPSVLTTLWSVQNLATYELTELFYKYINEGHPKDVALQLAKQEWLRNADQSNQAPNIWAGLIIVGDTRPLERTDYAFWVTIVTLLTLLGSGIWIWRAKKRKPKLSVSLPHSV
ncbi:CHAT domain-containing protein [Spirosoma sp.]|uniref:CHAT domain-containing protein n=1 Tax=Spirosoma sp. TaxID=1899569 RepID=UPI003B3A9164